MTTTTQTLGSYTAVTITGFNSLANSTFAAAASGVDLTATTPLDVLLTIECTPGTVSGNKQAVLFVQVSGDGADYTTGPTSGSTLTDQPNLMYVGSLPLNSNSTLQRKTFSLFAALGFCPRYFKPVVLNDSGAALAGSGNAVHYQTIVATS